MTEVVIGEAVALDLRPARVPSRALAFGIDVLAMGVVLILLELLVVLSGTGDTALVAALAIAVSVVVLVGWPTLWETLTRGRSPGKYALGLRVVRDDGGPIRFRHALTRALAGLIVDFGALSFFTGVVGLVVSASSERGKRVGDLMAGTIVLRERVPRTASAAGDAPPAVPPALAGWAGSLQLAALPDDLALAARQFLARAPTLDPRAREQLGGRLAGEVAARVAPAPPAGVPAEVYLTAVLGERYARATRGAGSWGPPGPGSGPAPTPGPTSPSPVTTAPASPPSGPAPAPSSPPSSSGGFAPPG